MTIYILYCRMVTLPKSNRTGPLQHGAIVPLANLLLASQDLRCLNNVFVLLAKIHTATETSKALI